MLTLQQLQTLKAAILADPTAAAYIPAGDAFSLNLWCQSVATPTFWVYRAAVPVEEIFNGITWANFTPVDTPDGTQIYANRALLCQGKQFNVQTLLVGRSTLDATRPNIRAALADALTNVPAGAGGAAVSAGWVTIRDSVLARAATNGEKAFATGGTGASQTTAAVITVTPVIEDLNKIIAGAV